MNSPQYTSNVGEKFHADGSARQYPGNTIICFGDPNSIAFHHASWIQDQLAKLPFAEKFTLLPRSSFHMTVFELLCDQVRVPGQWSEYLPLQTPLIETDEFFIQRLASLEAPMNFRMKYSSLRINPGIAILVDPIDTEAIRTYRNELSDITGIRSPHHDDYVFHISLAYQTIALNDEELKVLNHLKDTVDDKMKQQFGIFESGPPQLTFFNDMHRFVTADERSDIRAGLHSQDER